MAAHIRKATAAEATRHRLTTAGNPREEEEAKLTLEACARAAARAEALTIKGPDQAWRDFTEVSTIYQGETFTPAYPSWEYSDPNAEHPPECNPNATWKLPRDEAEQLGRDYDKAKYRQTKLESLLEATVNMASGFGVSWLVWMFIAAPLFGIEAPVGQAFALTCLFTITSMARSYAWRRFFATDVHKRIHSWLK